ncbi:hypothetical protein ACFL0L_05570 [Patescibacteria group bacterium]
MKQPKKDKKQVSFTRLFAGLILFVVALLLLFLLRGSEDRWMCDNGEWVKHGNPSGEKPTEECK